MVWWILFIFHQCHGAVLHPKHPIDFKPVIHKIFQSRAGNDSLDLSDAVQKIILSVAVKLGKHIIQKQNSIVFGNIFSEFYL